MPTAFSSNYPAWHFEPATPRQRKLLYFFGIDVGETPTKGQCSGVINRLFANPRNKQLWTAYVYTTGDHAQTIELLPCDRESLLTVVVPADWQPPTSTPSNLGTVAREQIVADLLREGSPFDDPAPPLSVAGTTFCFTGKFAFGSRKQCQGAVAERGGSFTDGVVRGTDVLVIGSDLNPQWSHGSYGNKISDAMLLRMERQKPLIVPENFWATLLA